jgi:predicted acylesterase/phospholipase RssA
MAQVAQGTTAAPTYFPPLHLESEGDLDEVVLIDGGLAANNPTSVAYYEGLAEERDLGIDVDFLIVSLGTGRPPEEVPTYQEIFSRSWLKLGMGLMGVIMDGTSEIVDELMRNIMVAKEPYGRYWRFQVDLKDCSLDMDRSDAAHLDHLIAIADELIAERQDDFRQIAEQLATKDLVRAPAAAPDATA